MPGPRAVVVIFLSIFTASTQGHEIWPAAESSNVKFYFGKCEPDKVCKLHHGGVSSVFPCYKKPQIADEFGDRITESINETSESVTLHNVTSSDAGYYQRECTNGNGEKKNFPEGELLVLGHVGIHEVSRNNTDGTISITVCPAKNHGVIIWTVNGGDLPDKHWLSPDNRTLTILGNFTGTIMVSNLVSHDKKSVTITRDLNGKSGHFGYVMHTNITRVIWGDYGGEPGMGTHIIPRNISSICVLLTPSDKTDEAQRSGSKRLGLCAELMVILVIIVIFVA